jgi:hypothetical protein
MKTDKVLTTIMAVLFVLIIVAAVVVGVLFVRTRLSRATPTAQAGGPTAEATGVPSSVPLPTEPEGEELEVVIPDTTHVLSGETVDSLSAISGDGAVFTFSQSTTELEALAPGDVMVGDVSSQAPDGFLRTVRSVSTDGGEVVVETEPARLEDAIDTGGVQLSQVLEPADVRAAWQRQGVALAALPHAPGPGGFVQTLDRVVLFDLDGDKSTLDDQIVADGELSFEPRLDFDLKIKGARIDRVSLVASASERVHLRISGDVQLLDAHEEVEVAWYAFHPITVWAGWVPVVLSPQMRIVVGLDGTASVAFDTSVTQQASLSAGLQYANRRWAPVADFSNDFSYIPPTLSASAHVQAYGGLRAAILIYGVGGPYAGLDGVLKLDANINRVPLWKLYGGLRAQVGIRFEILGYRLADESRTVLDRDFLLTSGGQRATDTPTPTPTATRPPTDTPTPTPTPTRTPTVTPTPTPTPPCAFDAQGLFASLWQTHVARLGCPLYPEPKSIQDAEQAFENGHVFWRQDADLIYVVYEKGGLAGHYQAFVDPWSEGDPLYSCEASPPAGRFQPARGIGAVWCQIGGPDGGLGWALGEEGGKGPGNGDPLVQDFARGVILRDSDGTTQGLAYVFFGDAGTFVREGY